MATHVNRGTRVFVDDEEVVAVTCLSSTPGCGYDGSDATAFSIERIPASLEEVLDLYRKPAEPHEVRITVVYSCPSETVPGFAVTAKAAYVGSLLSPIMPKALATVKDCYNLLTPFELLADLETVELCKDRS